MGGYRVFPDVVGVCFSLVSDRVFTVILLENDADSFDNFGQRFIVFDSAG